MEELSLKEFEIQGIEAPANSLPPLAQRELLVRGDYRGHGDPVEPAYPPLEHRQDGGTMKASTNAIQFLMTKEGFVSYFYYTLEYIQKTLTNLKFYVRVNSCTMSAS